MIGFNTKFHQLERINIWVLQQIITNYEKIHTFYKWQCVLARWSHRIIKAVKPPMYSKFTVPGTLSRFILQLHWICNLGYRFSEFQDSMVTNIFGQRDINPLQGIYRISTKHPLTSSTHFNSYLPLHFFEFSIYQMSLEYGLQPAVSFRYTTWQHIKNLRYNNLWL